MLSSAMHFRQQQFIQRRNPKNKKEKMEQTHVQEQTQDKQLENSKKKTNTDFSIWDVITFREIQ